MNNYLQFSGKFTAITLCEQGVFVYILRYRVYLFNTECPFENQTHPVFVIYCNNYEKRFEASDLLVSYLFAHFQLYHYNPSAGVRVAFRILNGDGSQMVPYFKDH